MKKPAKIVEAKKAVTKKEKIKNKTTNKAAKAEPTKTKGKQPVEKTKQAAVKDKKTVEKSKQSAVKESERKDPEKKDLEQEIVEESKALLTEEVEEADTEDLEKQETIIEDDSQDNGSELEISDIQEVEAVRGGSSGGGSGDFSSGGGGLFGGGFDFYIQKVDENGKPMKVAFKVTNLGTEESHIVMTGENGLSCTIIASRFKKFKIIEGNGLEDYITATEIDDLIKKITDSQEIEKPDIFSKDKKDNNENQGPPSQDPPIYGPKVDADAPDVDITGPKVDTGAPDVTIPDIELPPIDNDNQKKEDA